MNARVIHVSTKVSAQTEQTDSAAAAHQDLVGHNVKLVTVSQVYYMCTNKSNLFFYRFCDYNRAQYKQVIMQQIRWIS